MDGCGDACLPGRWRAETNAGRSEEVSLVLRDTTRPGGRLSPVVASVGDRERRVSIEFGVRVDGNEVAQSRAVESVRESLVGDRELGGILSSSPGRNGGDKERERRKSVKFVATDDRR